VIKFQDEINNAVIASSNKVRNKFPYANTFYDDLTQEGLVAAYEAMDNFDVDQGVSVTTYLYHRIYSHLKRYATKQMRASGTVSLEDPSIVPSSLQYRPQNDIRMDINTMLHSLKPYNRNLLIDYYFYRHTLVEMEPLYGKSRTLIKQDLTKVLSLLKSRYCKE